MTYSELERLDKADSLVNRAANREVVDSNLPGNEYNLSDQDCRRGAGLGPNGPEGTLGVDEEKTTEGDALFLDEDAVVTRDRHVLVSNQRKLEVGAESALLPGLRGPSKMGVVGVGRAACGE